MDQQTIIVALAVSVVGVLGVLLSVLAWVAVRASDKIDQMQEKIPEAIAALQTLVVDEMHRHDLRITKLEAWRDSLRKKEEAS